MKQFKLFIIAVSLALPALCFAQPICPLPANMPKPKQVESLEEFKRIPVLQNGRIKPLETYAQNVLLRFSGKRSLGQKPAIHWLARLLFAPDSTKDDKIFLINNPDIATALGIEPEEKRRYSFSQLAPVFPKLTQLAADAQAIDEKKRGIVENELIRVYQNLRFYSDLSMTFSFVFPHPDFTLRDRQTKEELGLPVSAPQFSFLDIALRANKLEKMTSRLEGRDMSQWSDAEEELFQIINNLFHWSLVYENLPLHIIPSYAPGEVVWLSPWDAIKAGLTVPQGRKELIALSNMVGVYWSGDQVAFDISVKSFVNSVEKRLEEISPSALKSLKYELFYNQVRPFRWALILYFAALFLVVINLSGNRGLLRGISTLFLWAAFLLHTTGIVLRIMILQRPPVSNLYETFIFVGFIAVIVGFLIEKMHKNLLGQLIAGVSGGIFLTIAGKFSADGDTLQMLVAVLNSNFWLSTHVLSITTGYAGVCVAGLVGHIYILQCIFAPDDKEKLRVIEKILLGTLGFGLTMTFLGTNLGGIWADQSWGRFWGWDPKENGALMIILWTAILFHAKIGKMIGPLGLAVGSAAGIMVVMWAWFGVNLLSVGLHSYGFTSGLATNLAIYAVCQLLFLAVCAPLAQKKLST